MTKYFKKHTLGIRRKNEGFIYLKPPFYEFWADPFIVEQEEDLLIFFEVFNYFKNKGHISYIVYDIKKNKIKEKHVILKKEYHLSYPQIIKDNGCFYLIPESYQDGTVSLYEFIDFPKSVIKKAELLTNVDNVDSTMFIKNNNYYLFTNPRFKERIDDKKHLNIYFSSNISGPFEKIPNVNINKYDKSNLRMAGNIFTKDNKIYRVSQNCERVYGEHMNINEIIKISPNTYIEKYISKLELNIKNNHHTFNQTENYEVIDIVKYTSIGYVFLTLFYRFPLKLINKIRRKTSE